MDPIRIALTGVLAPGAVALLVVVVLALVAKKPAATWRELEAPKWAGLALAVGFGLGFAFTLGWPALPPVDVTQVAPWVALFAAPLGFVAGVPRAVATAGLGVGLGLFLAAPLYDGAELVAHAALIGATVVALERGLALLVPDHNARGGALATLVFVSGAAAIILMSDTASLAITTGALAAGLGALVTASFVVPGLAKLERAAPVVAVVLATHLHASALYAGGRYDVLGLVAVTPLLLALALGLVARKERSTWLAVALPAALILVPLGAASALAATRYFAEPAASSVEPDATTPADDSDYGY